MRSPSTPPLTLSLAPFQGERECTTEVWCILRLVNMQPAMNRRKMLRWLAVGLPALGALPRWSAAEAAGQLRPGVDMNSYGIRWSNSAPPAARFKNILEMLEPFQQLGA